MNFYQKKKKSIITVPNHSDLGHSDFALIASVTIGLAELQLHVYTAVCFHQVLALHSFHNHRI